jgi:hypothetical protein
MESKLMETKSGNDLTDDKFVSQFNQVDAAALMSTLKKAKLCAQKVHFERRTRTLKQIGLSAAKFSKLVQIGRDTRFDDPAVQSLLPSGFSVLYALSLLSDEQWKKALNEKLIFPTVTRSAVDRLRRGPLPKKPRSLPAWLFLGISADKDMTPANKSRLEAAILKICEQEGAELIPHRGPRGSDRISEGLRQTRSPSISPVDTLVATEEAGDDQG